jgi:hypothetical protein
MTEIYLRELLCEDCVLTCNECDFRDVRGSDFVVDGIKSLVLLFYASIIGHFTLDSALSETSHHQEHDSIVAFIYPYTIDICD